MHFYHYEKLDFWFIHTTEILFQLCQDLWEAVYYYYTVIFFKKEKYFFSK